jgi:hypothetical protein
MDRQEAIVNYRLKIKKKSRRTSFSKKDLELVVAGFLDLIRENSGDFSQICNSEIEMLSEGHSTSAISEICLPYYRSQLQKAVDSGKILLPHGNAAIHPAISFFLAWKGLDDRMPPENPSESAFQVIASTVQTTSSDLGDGFFNYFRDLIVARQRLEQLLDNPINKLSSYLVPNSPEQEKKILDSTSKRPVVYCLVSIMQWNGVQPRGKKVFISQQLVMRLTEKRGTFIREVFEIYCDSIKTHNKSNGFPSSMYHNPVIPEGLWSFCNEQITALSLVIAKDKGIKREQSYLNDWINSRYSYTQTPSPCP